MAFGGNIELRDRGEASSSGGQNISSIEAGQAIPAHSAGPCCLVLTSRDDPGKDEHAGAIAGHD